MRNEQSKTNDRKAWSFAWAESYTCWLDSERGFYIKGECSDVIDYRLDNQIRRNPWGAADIQMVEKREALLLGNRVTESNDIRRKWKKNEISFYNSCHKSFLHWINKKLDVSSINLPFLILIYWKLTWFLNKPTILDCILLVEILWGNFLLPGSLQKYQYLNWADCSTDQLT